ncbi:hypothetical protein J2R62_19350, partial [Plesiomonas shigelloides]
EPQPYVSDPNAVCNVPSQPAGSVDGKVADAQDLKQPTTIARLSRANGHAFAAPAFLRAHQQWAWDSDSLKSRPSAPWVSMPLRE